jgi:hypothetical protein
MKIRRNVASIPARSAKETWRAITDLVTGTDSVDSDQLDAAASIMESLIADELLASAPIVFKGAGPRVVIYCLYGEDAMEAELDIDQLIDNPTAGDWRATAPCEAADNDWMNKTLNSRAPRICVHDVSEEPKEEETGKVPQNSALTIDWEALRKS